MVESQTTSLTPGPSFAHNLGYICPNDQCEAIFYIYASRPFQCHQEHLNARCFGSCCRTLNIRESRRTPNPQLWKCWASPPHLAKVGLRHLHCSFTDNICAFKHNHLVKPGVKGQKLHHTLGFIFSIDPFWRSMFIKLKGTHTFFNHVYVQCETAFPL